MLDRKKKVTQGSTVAPPNRRAQPSRHDEEIDDPESTVDEESLVRVLERPSSSKTSWPRSEMWRPSTASWRHMRSASRTSTNAPRSWRGRCESQGRHENLPAAESPRAREPPRHRRLDASLGPHPWLCPIRLRTRRLASETGVARGAVALVGLVRQRLAPVPHPLGRFALNHNVGFRCDGNCCAGDVSNRLDKDLLRMQFRIRDKEVRAAAGTPPMRRHVCLKFYVPSHRPMQGEAHRWQGLRLARVRCKS